MFFFFFCPSNRVFSPLVWCSWLEFQNDRRLHSHSSCGDATKAHSITARLLGVTQKTRVRYTDDKRLFSFFFF